MAIDFVPKILAPRDLDWPVDSWSQAQAVMSVIASGLKETPLVSDPRASLIVT